MHLGLIGGIGPAATNLYYEQINRRCRARDIGFDLTMVHADVATLLENQKQADKNAQLAIYTELAERLRAAGADRLIIPSISGHFCLGGKGTELPLPILDLIDAVNRALARKQYSRIGILGTREAMESRLYGRLNATEMAALEAPAQADVHTAYVGMASRGHATREERSIIETAYDTLLYSHGAEVVLLAGTDLSLIFDEMSDRRRVLDCADVHIEAIVEAVVNDAR